MERERASQKKFTFSHSLSSSLYPSLLSLLSRSFNMSLDFSALLVLCIVSFLSFFVQIVDEASTHNYWTRVSAALHKLPPSDPSSSSSPSSSTSTSDDDKKLLTLKKVARTVVSDFLNVCAALQQVIETSTLPQEIILLVKVVQELKTLLVDSGM